ncbi:Uncharacterized protein FWK35_00009088 [Aphis craccivora]|uniref:Uncharacterized protein n=1 Tax=Aphis craccivora TaxID=307492 RepID=A0A6G0ZGM3_APHCR|nr:Uncharacterized protein FWK35_00009088 [Aphis craccivora]
METKLLEYSLSFLLELSFRKTIPANVVLRIYNLERYIKLIKLYFQHDTFDTIRNIVTSITLINTAFKYLSLNFSSFSDSKVNLVGALRRSFFEILNNFQKHREKQKKK